MDTQISRITEFDSDLIRELFEKAGISPSEPEARFFEDEKNIMLVSRTGGDLSGFLWAYVLVSPDRPGNKMFLYSIDTFEPFRRQGIATLLIQHLKEIARSYNCYKMFVPTSKTNLPAVALYRKTGGIAADYDNGVSFEYDLKALNT